MPFVARKCGGKKDAGCRLRFIFSHKICSERKHIRIIVLTGERHELEWPAIVHSGARTHDPVCRHRLALT